MNAFRLVVLITINLVAGEEANISSVAPEAKNFRFEDQPNAQTYGLIRFEEQNQEFDGSHNTIDDGHRIKFEADSAFLDNRFQQYDNDYQDNQNINEGQKIQFDEDKRIKRPNHQKKKRRRRPKRLPNGAQGYPVQQYPGSPVYPGQPGYPGPPMFGPDPIYPGQRPYQPYPGPLYKPRPSATSAALSAVTEALSSIALYDDAQCVPLLLCEAAGGGSLPGSGILQSVAGLQPLLTLLSAYSGISSSPLFVFGRAVFLGMTSKANPGTCRYAYPQCPNDTEQLVHYLNNHNGGFFRFFAAPQLNQQQGLEQFYNQLSGQNYGFYQPQPLQPNQLPNQNLQGYGLQQNQNQYYGQQFGQHQQQQFLQQYQNQNLQGYGLQPQFNMNYQRPNPYGNGYGLYGQNYPYQKSLNQSSFDNKIQRRIQNVRTGFLNNVSSKPKWLFPEDSSSNRDVYSNVRLGKVLKFPQSYVNSITAAEGFVFPGIQSNREYPIDNIEAFDNSFEKGLDDFRFFNQNNDETTLNDSVNSPRNNKDDVRVLYIVRENGDPNHPEIVRLAPGQTL